LSTGALGRGADVDRHEGDRQRREEEPQQNHAIEQRDLLGAAGTMSAAADPGASCDSRLTIFVADGAGRGRTAGLCRGWDQLARASPLRRDRRRAVARSAHPGVRGEGCGEEFRAA
jgi:hypothetical protein